jgi:hypothetical protein
MRDEEEFLALATDLVDAQSSRYPAERIVQLDASENMLVLDCVPPMTEFLSIQKKFAINHNLMSQSEPNLCVRVTCLGAGGIPLENYDGCYIKAGRVRDWMVKNNRFSLSLANRPLQGKRIRLSLSMG